MWLTIITTVLGFIPGLSDLTAKLLASKFDKDVKMYAAKTGVAKEVAVEAIRANAQVQTKWWFVALVPVIWAVPFIAFDTKIVVWDKMLGWGVTDPLDPNMWYVHMTIVGGFFAHAIADKILERKD